MSVKSRVEKMERVLLPEKGVPADALALAADVMVYAPDLAFGLLAARGEYDARKDTSRTAMIRLAVQFAEAGQQPVASEAQGDLKAKLVDKIKQAWPTETTAQARRVELGF